MHRINKSAHGPTGTAFFLFLGLAIVPISLRAAGFQVSFSPSLSAAVDAWQQIADVFGAGYQPARTFDVSAPSDSRREPLRAYDSATCPRSEFVCSIELGRLSPAYDAQKVPATKVGAMRSWCPKAAPRAPVATTSVESTIAAAAIRVGLEKHARALQTLTEFQPVLHQELLSDFEKQILERSLTTMQSLRVLVRMKAPSIPSSTKAAECKVRAALDSARRLERERAIVTSLTSASPDNCEL